MNTILILALIATVLALLVCAMASAVSTQHKHRTSNSEHRTSNWRSRFMLGLQEALVLPANHWRQFRYRQKIIYGANIAEGTHLNSITRKADAAFASRYLLAKYGSDANHVAISTANAAPLGVATDEAAAAEDLIAVELIGISNRTLLMVASEPIAANVDVYTAAAGKIQDLPAGAGTYYKVGRTLTAAGADGDVVEVAHCHPVATVVAG